MKNEFILCSKWGPAKNCREPEYFKNHLIDKCGLPEFISKKINSVIIKERIVANSWASAFKFGRIGKTATVVDFYVVMNCEGLNEAQKTAIDSFWNGFLFGRDSKSFF